MGRPPLGLGSVPARPAERRLSSPEDRPSPISNTSHWAEHDFELTQAASGPAWQKYLRAFGPGFVTGASDDDPSGIATYAQSGAKFGFGMLWSALITLPLMSAVQEICDRTALARGQGLGELVTRKFRSGWRFVIAVLIAALIVANMLNIAADLVAIGEGAHLLHAGPAWVWALVGGGVLTALITSGSFHLIARVFKVLTRITMRTAT